MKNLFVLINICVSINLFAQNPFPISLYKDLPYVDDYKIGDTIRVYKSDSSYVKVLPLDYNGMMYVERYNNKNEITEKGYTVFKNKIKVKYKEINILTLKPQKKLLIYIETYKHGIWWVNKNGTFEKVFYDHSVW